MGKDIEDIQEKLYWDIFFIIIFTGALILAYFLEEDSLILFIIGCFIIFGIASSLYDYRKLERSKCPKSKNMLNIESRMRNKTMIVIIFIVFIFLACLIRMSPFIIFLWSSTSIFAFMLLIRDYKKLRKLKGEDDSDA